MSGEFVATAGDISNFPELFTGEYLKGRREPRIAMVGRSNVGKSSLINALIGGQMAQVSKQPGKTRAIHFYYWKEIGKIIADLPGFGYAVASSEEQNRWASFINGYFEVDPGLERAVVLLDARHGPTPKDEEAIRFLVTSSVPIQVVFSKVDSLKNQAEVARRKKETTVALQKLRLDPKSAIWVSSKTKDGLKALTQSLASLQSDT